MLCSPVSCPCVDLSSGFLSQRAILGLKKTVPVTSWLLRLLVTHFPSSSSQTLFRANSPTLHSSNYDLGCPTHHEGPKHVVLCQVGQIFRLLDPVIHPEQVAS